MSSAPLAIPAALREVQRVLLESPPLTVIALADVARERERQERVCPKKGLHTCSSNKLGHPYKLCILAEEVGEVARQIQEGTLLTKHRAHLREELIQVAAVAVAWAESLTPREGERPRETHNSL